MFVSISFIVMNDDITYRRFDLSWLFRRIHGYQCNTYLKLILHIPFLPRILLFHTLDNPKSIKFIGLKERVEPCRATVTSCNSFLFKNKQERKKGKGRMISQHPRIISTVNLSGKKRVKLSHTITVPSCRHHLL